MDTRFLYCYEGNIVVKLLFIGDIVARSGREILKEQIQNIKLKHKIDFCIANGENAAGGKGLTYIVSEELFEAGIDAITMGNHTWGRSEILKIIDTNSKIVRPANYAKGVPGKGRTIIKKGDYSLGIINLIGRVYMEPVDCPFMAADKEINNLKGNVDFIMIDFHAEATSEKIAMGYYVDGRASLVVGTHTHVQTADEKILEKGTAYITDVGMTGPSEGVIGVDREIIMKKFLKGMPGKYEPQKGSVQFNAVIVEFDDNTKKAILIERISSKVNG